MDGRIIAAARRLKDEEIANAIVLGKPEQIQAAAATVDVNLDGIETINPGQSDKVEFYAEKYIERRADVPVAGFGRYTGPGRGRFSGLSREFIG